MPMERIMQQEVIDRNLEAYVADIIRKIYGKTIDETTDAELYNCLLIMCREVAGLTKEISGDKRLFYVSAEFLIGRLLINNLINMGLFESTRELLEKHGRSLEALDDMEPEPALGNGGLGRLAACFMDSITSLGYCGEGIGINYHFGLFRQYFKNCKQMAQKDCWIAERTWLTRTNDTCEVRFGELSVTSRRYEITVCGYGGFQNRLSLFDIDSVDESIVGSGIDFDKTDIEKNLTLFLYPDDSDEAGRLLRIYQQYFLVSSAAQHILRCLKINQYDLRKMYNHAVIQINDTHPTLIIPELIRILVEDKAFTMDEAIEVVEKCCAYTNHTILAEALEKWPLEYLEKVVPQLVPVIRYLSDKVREKYEDPRVQIIDDNQTVHMAHIDIHYGFSVNGVAQLHTEILKTRELKPFYDLYPEKFNNKTNGVSFRRWLGTCNPELTKLLLDNIGNSFTRNPQRLEKLLLFTDDRKMLRKLMDVKHLRKQELADYIYKHEGIKIDADSVFDVQTKRLHEYKRQHMNALYIIHKYLEIKAGRFPKRPITFIFGAKASPAYVAAQDIIHLILVLQKLINKDPEASKYIRVVMVTNYNVAYAQKIIPAADISEQISLASKEASGTGNMKLMLNGAVTLCTLDGANIEIADLVGENNIYIFGRSSADVMEHEAKGDYNPGDYYRKSRVIREALDFIVSEQCLKTGDKKILTRLHNEILCRDRFMALLDLKEYIKVKDRMLADYEKPLVWAKKVLMNIACAGRFSSDRTVKEYNDDIWKL